MAAVTRRQYKGAAAPCTTTNSLTSVDTSVTLSAITGWPSTAAVPFYVVIDPGTSSEEKCSATISGSTLTLTRGQDDTTAVAHSSGATIYPVFSADDADEANNMASTMTTKGDLLVTTGSAFNRLAVGTNGFGLIADSGSANGVKWGTPYNQTVSTKTASYTLVAADVGTRIVMNSASATTITVNTSLFAAGDTLSIHNIGAGVCTVTAGTATVSSAGRLAINQYGGGELFFSSASAAVWFPNAATTIQVVNSQTGAVATGTTTIPFDDTIPQNTEGTEFLTLAITPQSATSTLIINVVLNYSYSIANTLTFALFQDSTASAIAASAEYDSAAQGMVNSTLTHKMTSGTTSATTFKVRAGATQAGTFTLNGTNGARNLGGVMISSITITEYAA